MDPLQVNNRSHSPSQFLVISFLVRVITELHCNSCTTETVGLVNFNTPGLEYIPSQLMLQLPEVTFISVDLNRKFVKQKNSFYVPIILHGFSAETELEVEKLVQLFALYGKEKKVIIVNRRNNNVSLVMKEYRRLGVIDVIVIDVKSNSLEIISLNNLGTKTRFLSVTDQVANLFPDRLKNLSGQPYRVAILENLPFSYATNKNYIVGVDVDFINIIAKHQSTFVEYKYTEHPQPMDWSNTSIDFATYRFIQRGFTDRFSALYFPNQFRWCIAVPKQYQRIIHEQVIWSFEVDLWILVSGIVIFYFIYQIAVQQVLLQRYPNVYAVINTPLKILRILLLFLLTEYYTAMLTSNLGSSMIPNYPQTLHAFSQSAVPIIDLYANSLTHIILSPELKPKVVQRNASQQYDPTQFAVMVMCDYFSYLIRNLSSAIGSELSHHHYHLIEDPISAAVCMSPFRKTSPRLGRFQMYVSRLNQAGIWDFLVRKWRLATNDYAFTGTTDDSMISPILKLDHFVPVFTIFGYMYVGAVVVFLLEIVVGRYQRRAN